MGRVWGPDAVAKSQSTSFYGNIVALTESPLVRGPRLRRHRRRPRAGHRGRRQDLAEDREVPRRAGDDLRRGPRRLTHDANIVYAAFDNHKIGDFKPYLLQSADRGRTWASVASDLPPRGSTWSVAEDPKDREPALLRHRVRRVLLHRRRQKWRQARGRPAHDRRA